MDGRGNRIRCRRQDRTRLDPLPARVFPAIPQPCEREQFTVINFKTVRLFRLSPPLPLVESVRWDEAPATGQRIEESRLRRWCPDLALIAWAAIDGSFAHDGR